MFVKNIIMNKNRVQTIKQSEEKKCSFFQKVIDDKRAIHAYISKHGTLNGFKRDSIEFVKPL